MFDIEKELKKLPDKPGVYIMKDKDDHIIYVGKAISLRKRVRQYFRKNRKTKRIENMVSLVDHFEYIVTDNESEALILECNLIKKNMPKFNVLLKDDKTYPYIKIDMKSKFPNVYLTRKILNDGAKYYGPYASSGNAKEMLDFINNYFQIRQCKNFKERTRGCLNYQIKKCPGPCIGKITEEEYHEQIVQIMSLLEGNIARIEKVLDKEIREAANKLEFEKAAELRDKKIAIQRVTEEKQKVSNISLYDIDVIGIAKSEMQVCVELFMIRDRKMVERRHYFFEDLQDEKNKEILYDFIKQYYMDSMVLPNKIMIKEEIEDKELLEEWLSQMAGRKVEIKVPQKGEKLRLLEMAEKNADITLKNKEKEKVSTVMELKEILKLPKLPRKIEGYDISNLAGKYIVSAMCVLKDGEVNKSLSRKFQIKTVLGQDDPRCIWEVIKRRLRHSMERTDGPFGNFPDVIFVDGGITQIKAAKQAIAELGLSIPVYGMVKNSKHRTRALLDENRNEIALTEELMNVITAFQDCIHDTAINYHRKLRDKQITESALNTIEGIGEVRKKELLKRFGTISGIKNASCEQLAEVNGITIELAQRIKKTLEK